MKSMKIKTTKKINPYIKLVLACFLLISSILINNISPYIPNKISFYLLLLGFIPLLILFTLIMYRILKMIRNIPDKSLINSEPEPTGLTSVGLGVVSFFFSAMTIIRFNFSLFSIIVFGIYFLLLASLL